MEITKKQREGLMGMEDRIRVMTEESAERAKSLTSPLSIWMEGRSLELKIQKLRREVLGDIGL